MLRRVVRHRRASQRDHTPVCAGCSCEFPRLRSANLSNPVGVGGVRIGTRCNKAHTDFVRVPAFRRDSEPPFAPDVRADSHACGAQTYPTPLGLERSESLQDAIKPTRTKSVSWRDSEPPFAPNVRANSYVCGAQTYPTPRRGWRG